MFNTLIELFLNTYFMFDCIAGKLISDTKSLFDKLFSVFLMPEKERELLFALTQCDEVREIQTYGDYAQICRIQKYAELSEIESRIPADVQAVIGIKGDVLRKVKQFGYEEYGKSSESAVCGLMTQSANMGLIPSLCVLGFLQCEGLFVEKNIHLGIKNIRRTAKWNNIEGLLLSLYYDAEYRSENLSRLFTVTQGEPHESVYAAAVSAYGAACEVKILPETKMLQKAFGAGILKSDLYTSQYARFIYSKVLSLKDKERALFSGHKEIIAETTDLPLKLTCGKITFDDKPLCELPLVREGELDKISRAILNSDLRKDLSYRPLCISCDSDYLLRLYLAAMSKAFCSAHTERIDIADLNEYDVEPTKNNVFVRSCDESGQNAYMLYLKGGIRDFALNAVKNFLPGDKRRKFRLQHPGVEIDLRAVLPVCFCDYQNARILKQYCDVVTLAPVSEAEKSKILSYIIQTKTKRYKVKSVQADTSAQKILLDYSVDEAERMVDKAVRDCRSEEALIITADILKEISNGDFGTRTKFGFGGFEQ